MMKEDKNCKDCLYYKEITKPLFKKPIRRNKPLEILDESICKVHEERYSSNRQWHPVNMSCFTQKE